MVFPLLMGVTTKMIFGKHCGAVTLLQSAHITLFNTDQLYFTHWQCNVQSFFGLTRYREVAWTCSLVRTGQICRGIGGFPNIKTSLSKPLVTSRKCGCWWWQSVTGWCLRDSLPLQWIPLERLKLCQPTRRELFLWWTTHVIPCNTSGRAIQ